MKRWWLVILAGLAGFCFNNWLFGLVLNHHLLFSRGAVSELSALDQPHQLLFRSLDVVAGILFVALAAVLARTTPRRRGYKWLVYGTAALGIANVLDAFQPLACSETLNKSCVIPVQVSLSHLSIPTHGYSSIVIAICYLLLPLAGWAYAKGLKAKNFKFLSVALTVLATAYLLAAVLEYLISGTFSDKAWGPTQEVQMLLLGIWFVLWAWNISLGKFNNALKNNN